MASAASAGVELVARGGSGLTLIAPDQRGRADSATISGPFLLAQYVADLIVILDQLEIDSAHAYGISMGGFVAMRLAAEPPAQGLHGHD